MCKTNCICKFSSGLSPKGQGFLSASSESLVLSDSLLFNTGNGLLTIYIKTKQNKETTVQMAVYITAKTQKLEATLSSVWSKKSGRKILAFSIIFSCFSGGQHLIYTCNDPGGRLHKLLWFSL